VACDDAPLPGIAQLKNIGACSLWHVDEVLLTIDGERHYVWPAADQDSLCPTSRYSAGGTIKRRRHSSTTSWRAWRIGRGWSSRINSSTMGRSCASCCPVPNIGNTGGKLPPTNTLAGMMDAAVQVGRARPVHPHRVWGHCAVSPPLAPRLLLEYTASRCPRDSKGAPSKMSALDHAHHAREVTGLRTTATDFALWVIGGGMARG